MGKKVRESLLEEVPKSRSLHQSGRAEKKDIKYMN